MWTIDEIIEILKGKNEKKISIFCGSGISARSGLPTVSILLEYILVRLGIEHPDITFLRNADGKWIMPFESFMDVFIEHDKNTMLFNIFLLGKPNRNHLLIKKLAALDFLDEVYTTNFDLLIERIFAADPKIQFKVILENDADTNDKNNTGPCFPIIKLHGTADNVDTIKSTILSITSGEGFENRKKLIRRAFNSTSYVLWFWGYSCSDALDISPTIELIPPNKKTVILLEHDPSIKEINRAIIVPLAQAGSNHPLQKFNGYMVKINSDLLVHNILGKDCNYIEETIDPSEWQDIVEEWIKSFEHNHIKYSILAHLFYHLALYELALKYNELAIKTNNGKDKRGEGAALSNRGMMLFNVGKRDEAINLFRDALKIFKKISYSFGIATSYNNIGHSYGQVGKVEEGLKYIQSGLEYVKKKKFREALLCKGYLLQSRGELEMIEGKFMIAEESFNLALDIFRQGYKAEESEVLMLKGRLYRLIGRIDLSDEIIKEAITLANKVGRCDVAQKCARILTE